MKYSKPQWAEFTNDLTQIFKYFCNFQSTIFLRVYQINKLNSRFQHPNCYIKPVYAVNVMFSTLKCKIFISESYKKAVNLAPGAKVKEIQ